MTKDDGERNSIDMVNGDTCSLDCGCRLTIAKSTVNNQPVAMLNRCDRHESIELYERISSMQLDGREDE
jgi:hypothetical protein